MSSDIPASAGIGSRITRLVVLIGGLVVAGVGIWKLLQSGTDNVIDTLTWLIGGVVAHDGLLAPLTVVVLFAAAQILPSWLKAPATTGLVVLGTVTVSAIPVLGRFGARPDNPSLLDRNYIAGWLVFAALVALAVAVAAWRRRGAAVAAQRANSIVPTPVAGWRNPP